MNQNDHGERDEHEADFNERFDMVVNAAIATSEEARRVRTEVKAIGGKQRTDRMILLGVALLFVGLAALVAQGYDSNGIARNNSEVIKDCIVAGGECARVTGTVGALNRDIIVFRIEESRLLTTIEAAQVAGNADTTGVVYKNRLAKVQEQLRTAEAQLLQLQREGANVILPQGRPQ